MVPSGSATRRARPLRLDFVIAGVQKAGTTALASFLREHPDVGLPVDKEVHLFDDPEFEPSWHGGTVERRYAEAFGDSGGESLIGEATPIYCYWPHIAVELRRHNPELRLIVLIRDPVERAISHHRMERERGHETLPLLPALLAEPFRLWRDRGDRSPESSWRRHSYVDRGFYARQLADLYRVFPREQVLVIECERLWSEHDATLGRVYAFLGLEPPMSVPPRAAVFSAGPDPRPHRLARAFLRVCFTGERERLRALLPELDLAW